MCKRTLNGRMIFTADCMVDKSHVHQLLLLLLSMNRYVHVNTGTHGMEDGSCKF